MKIGLALTFAVAGLLVCSAAPPPSQSTSDGQFIAWPEDSNEGLIIPADSPVRFRRFDKYGVAQFEGRFVLTGTVIYGCAIDCDGKPADRFLRADIVPDPALAARLPHWKIRNNDIRIVIDPPERFVRTITTSRQRADLRSLKLADVQGRIAIVVDHFEVGIDCDSASFSARFVSTSAAPQFAAVSQNGNYGCG